MVEILCFQVPQDHDLETLAGWSKLDPKTYSAVRTHLILIKRRENRLLTGPLVSRVDVPAGSEYVIRRKEIETTTHMIEVQQLVQQTITARITEEFASKVSAEIGSSGPLPTAKVANEAQAKALHELADAVQRSVSGKQSFGVQRTTEVERSITVKTTADGAPAPLKHLHLYLGLWPWRWDFYLYRIEVLRLKYERRWLWQNVRKTFAAKTLTTRQPLFSLRFYEPLAEVSVSDGAYVAEVADPEAIEVAPLTDVMPNLEFPLEPALGELARVAFPVTGEERLAAGRKAQKVVRGVKTANARGRTASGRSAAEPKVGAMEKATPKKAAARKATRTLHDPKQAAAPKRKSAAATPSRNSSGKPKTPRQTPTGR